MENQKSESIITEIQKITKGIKPALTKNNYVLGFSIVSVFFFLLSVLNYFGANLYFGHLNLLSGLFHYGIWIFLAFMFACSAILAYFEKYKLMFVPILIWLLFTTAMIRTANVPYLVNAATGEPVLGPDLDPYLFTRLAKDIIEGRLENPDMMRGYPHGTPNYAYVNSEAWKIATVYWVTSLFNPNFTPMQAAIYSTPVWFTLSIIPLFLLLFYLLSFTLDKKESMVGATIGSFFYAMAPVILPRSVAGVPESEGHAFIWLFMALLFFVLAWKQKELKKVSIFAFFLGIFTVAMAWTWGGFSYIFMVVALTSFLAFLFEKEKTKNLVIMGFFVGVSFLLILPKYILSDRGLQFGIMDLTTSLTDTGLAFAVFGFLLVDYLIFRTSLNKKLKKYIEKVKLPENVLSMLVAGIIGSILLLIVKPSFLIELFPKIFETLLTPFGSGRFAETVAEHRIPYFDQVVNTFGYLFWIFFFSTIFIFYEGTKHFKLKEKFILNFSFLIFIITFMFSRISPNHVLDGASFLSKTLYFGGVIIFGLGLIYTYVNAHVKKDEKTIEDFKRVPFNYLFMISTSILAIFSLRVAIRFFIMASILMLPAISYIPVKLFRSARKTNDESAKIFFWGLLIIVCLLLANMAIIQTNQIQATTRGMVPSHYHEQWHKAMHWVTQNTPEDAVFSHWWDYGYWVQTLGERATIADGGYWVGPPAHFLGRYVLTTSNPQTALDMLKTFGASYLLIDSTDIGKYSAFSSIGSDETGKDRLSWIPVMESDSRQIEETRTGIRRTYQGGSVLDKDLIYETEDGEKIFFPERRAGVAGIILEYYEHRDNVGASVSFQQPIGVFVYNNRREDLPIRYLYYNGEIVDFGMGVNSTIVLVDKLEQNEGGMMIDSYGALIYLSEKTMDTLFAQLYLMDDPYNRYPTVEIAHKQDDFVVEFVKSTGMSNQDFIFYGGIRGPIKIWKVNYDENVVERPELLERYRFGREDAFGKLDYLWE